ncbi:MAG TPA: hypothetical protein VE990_10175 [Acidimicrobiales bacterium]|nr:hypothetical protein [Acidimicrobiales bacterium]
MRRLSASSLATFVAVGGMVAFVFWQLEPSLLFANTTTAGGDTGAHVALPAFLRDHLLTHGRVTGWDPGWYDGFPLFSFYFPLPSLIVVLLNLVIPYNIAFKLVTVLGSLALPAAAWGMGRLWGLRNTSAACLGVATLPYLFDRSYTIYGGNIASTLAGEYAFSLSLAVGLVFLGVVGRGLRTGRHAGLAAFLLAVTGLCHLLPTLFVIVGAVVIFLMHGGWRRLRWTVAVGVVGGLLAGFWWIPFAMRLAYTTDMGWEKIHAYWSTLMPSSLYWVGVLAASGAVASLALRRRLGTFITVMAALSALGFVVAPQGKIWNARLLPFWVLCLYLLAGLAVAEFGTALARLSGRVVRGSAFEGSVVVPLSAAAAAVVFVALPLQVLPSWFPLHTADHSFIPDWVKWNYTGYQRKAAYPEYRSVIETMAGVGAEYGCGRAMWEYEPELNRFGTPMALMLLPYWTNGCINTQEGLLFESASSTPYHFLDQSELSVNPSDAMLGLPYSRGIDVAAGIQHMQLLGVRYYMTFSPQIQAEANTNPDLKLVATTGPWSVTYTDGVKQRTWYVYEIRNSAMVTPLSYEPAVVPGSGQTAKSWLNVSVAWYDDPGRWQVPLAASGPPSWPRVGSSSRSNVPEVPVAPTTVSHIRTGDDRISFDVSRTGTPVLVKASYFPNWQATGANGPWRVTPNLTVVVPTSHHVSIHYGWTPVDGIGWLSTLLGVVGIGLLNRWGPWPAPPPPPAPVQETLFTEAELAEESPEPVVVGDPAP